MTNIDALVSGAGQAFFYMSPSVSETVGLERQTYFCTLACQNANVRAISAFRGGLADAITLQRTSSGWASSWLSLNDNMVPQSISTGITGVSAYKIGRMVFLRFYDFKVASDFSAQLPDSLKPITSIYITLSGRNGSYNGVFTVSAAGVAGFNATDYDKYYYGTGTYVSAN